MGKFDGILFCTDLDGTLLDQKREVSAENIAAIDYFQSEGGKFTFVTGRVPSGAKLLLEYFKPSIPIVCYNGAGIFDFEKNSLLWGCYLSGKPAEVLAYVDRFKKPGIIVCFDDCVKCCRNNKLVEEYFEIEKLEYSVVDYNSLGDPWKKVLLVEEPPKISEIIEIIQNSEFAERYDYVRSTSHYYEILPKNASKGNGLIKLCEMIGADKNRTIAVGDNENDISMFAAAKIGAAVGNASDKVKGFADLVTATNNEHAIARLVSDLDSGKIVL